MHIYVSTRISTANYSNKFRFGGQRNLKLLHSFFSLIIITSSISIYNAKVCAKELEVFNAKAAKKLKWPFSIKLNTPIRNLMQFVNMNAIFKTMFCKYFVFN